MNKPLKCTNRASEVTSCILQLGGGGGGGGGVGGEGGGVIL